VKWCLIRESNIKKIILLLILFLVIMGFFTIHDKTDSGIFVFGFMVGLYLLFWATIIAAVLGILKMLLRGATRVVRSEMDRQ
jgi:asparagine N-glycosylation enzyme membrane subunit Stt3